MSGSPRVLIIAHGHPDLSKGGAEVVAHHLFGELKNRGVDCLLLARAAGPAHGGSTFSARRSTDELLFHTAMGDFFNFRTAHPQHVWRDFRELLQRFEPDVVHFHHYIHLGLELIREVRNTCPAARIVLTLHEFGAICANQGQMVKARTLELCHESSPSDCARCFPERSPADFFLRKRYIESFFDEVDQFISPSAFLRDRYVAWGLPPERIEVIENGQPEVKPFEPRPLPPGDVRGRFAFFGQINPYKGIDVLLRAVSLLSTETRERIHVNIHGANLEIQTDEYQATIQELLEDTADVVSMCGPYAREDLGQLMEGVDWVIIPSIWWENSPMVIQEAFSYGRPVIASDIGGMAEKVGAYRGGLNFRAGSPRHLADAIERLVDDNRLFEEALESIPHPLSLKAWADEHLRVYDAAPASSRLQTPQ